MKHVVTLRDRFWFAAASIGALLCLDMRVHAAPGAGGEERQVAVASTPDALRESVSLIQNGRFEAASSRLAPVAGTDPAAAKLSKWLDSWNEQVQMRAELTQADYDKYVEWAKKYHAKQEYFKALDYAVRALQNAVNKEAFRQDIWVAALIRDAMTKGGELREKKEWLDALAIYYEIGEIQDRDANVRKLIRECRTHARLDALYKDDVPWQERLEGIELRMVEEAFRAVEQKYVEEPDFRALTEAGLEQMLYLAESSSLRKLFKNLDDPTLRQMFEDRLRANLVKVRGVAQFDRRAAVQQFRNVLEKINAQTVRLPDELLVNEFMEACSEELDEFTSMIWPAQIKEFEKHTEGEFVGVGIQIRQHYNPDLKENEIIVFSPLEDTPAYRAGIQTGDIITKVDGESITGITLTKAVDIITGPAGTSVKLAIRREGEEKELEYTLVRDTIKIQSIKGFARDATDDQKWQYMIDPEHGIAYVRVVNFQQNTVEDLVKTLEGLRAQNLRGLILDLRFNPGGLLRSAVEFSELFLPKGSNIVSTKGLHSPKWGVDAGRDGMFKDLPLVLLVNDSSASASEIVSGAIKDHRRGLVVGERTFGKFSVQNLIQLASTDAHLKLTTARYYLPSGRSLHREDTSVEWGVEPDVHVPLVPKELVKIGQRFRTQDIIGNKAKTLAEKAISDEDKELEDAADRAKDPDSAADGEKPADADAEPGDAAASQPAEEEDKDPNDRPEIDPQLDCALLVLRARLLDGNLPVVARSNAQSPEIRSE